tara:strand:- start:243 stop:476 length:234 start_codon:yes stop_codon:yes gene_type:complete
MNTRITIDTTTMLLISCYQAKITATVTATLLASLTDNSEKQDVLAAVYIDSINFKNGMNEDIYKFARAVLTKLEQGV